MKKTNILKIAFTLVLAFVVFGASSQILVDYTETAEDAYQTVGVTFRIYVEPDPAYNPSWVAATNVGVDADARWTWTYPAGLGTGTPLSAAVTNSNTVEFVGPTVGGPYAVTVVEGSVLSGCTDAAGPSRNIYVIAAPTADIAGGSANNAWVNPVADHEFNICGAALAEDITVTFTETGVLAANSRYAYYVQKRVVVIDGADVEQAASEVITALVDHPIATKTNIGTADGGTQATTSAAMSLVQFDWGSGLVDSRTKYEFTIMKPSDAAVAAGQGVVSAISHKSDWLTIDGGGDVTTYPFAVPGAVTVVYIVNPTPVTGPIYTIPNAQFH